jgi:hypothetical protein
MIAPLIGGVLLGINRAVPVYTAVAIFLAAGISVLMIEEKESTESRDGPTLMH